MDLLIKTNKPSEMVICVQKTDFQTMINRLKIAYKNLDAMTISCEEAANHYQEIRYLTEIGILNRSFELSYWYLAERTFGAKEWVSKNQLLIEKRRARI